MKHKISKLCNIIRLIFIVCFVIKTIYDYGSYSSTLNSAPFYLWILANAICLVLPALILFIVGIVLKKKKNEVLFVKQ